MPPPDATNARALRDALRALVLAHGALDDARRPCGTPLPMPHAWALLELNHAGAMTVTELASRLNIDRTNVSRLCARMESSGELTRETHPGDARARVLTLTEAGARLATSVDEASCAHFGDVMERLGDAPGALRALTDLTHALAHREEENP